MFVDLAFNGYEIDLLAGDIVCLAGNLHAGARLPWEHVAVVVKDRKIRSQEEMLETLIFGLPESILSKNHMPRFVEMTTGHFYQRRPPVSTGDIGDQTAGWNVLLRLDSGRSDIVYSVRQGLVNAGKKKFAYDATEGSRIRETFFIVHTNCVGFVRYVYRPIAALVEDYFHSYASPYEDDEEMPNYPSPGHLARSCHLSSNKLPYCSEDENDAACYSSIRAIRKLMLDL